MELNFTRRLQSINGCAFISLPKAWARSRGLKKGDRICVSLLKDGSLKIAPLEAT